MFEPGSAPFRVKGNAYRGHQQYVETQLPGGPQAQRDALCEMNPRYGPVWATFLEQAFLASRWYDTYPLAVAGIACSRVTDEPFLEFVHRRTCIQARQDIGAMHQLLLRFVSTRIIAKRVPLVASQYFDFVTATATDDGARIVSGELAGIPVDLAPWWTTMANAYVATAIEIARRLLTFTLGDADALTLDDAARIRSFSFSPRGCRRR